MNKANAERVPDWYGAVVLYFPTTVPIERLEAALSGPLKINTYYDIAGTMNNIRACVDEIVLNDIVYS